MVFSDLFIDGHHFEWVLDTLLDLYQNHPTEDDLLTQYSLPVICKALAFLKTVSLPQFDIFLAAEGLYF